MTTAPPDDNWNKAVANEAFRRCMLEGLDLTTYYARTNAINPLKCENDFYTMQGVCYNTSGKDYTELVRERMGYGQYDGETMVRTRGADIAALKQQAMDELSAIGVTFPVHCYYPILSGNTTPAGQRRRAASVLHRQPGRRLYRLGCCRVRLLHHPGDHQRPQAQHRAERLGR